MSLNEITLNESELNTSLPPVSEGLDIISFNGYGLQNGSIITGGENFWFRNIAQRDISLIRKPQSDGDILNSAFFGGRNIRIVGALKSDTKQNLDDLIDDFKLNLSPVNKKLRRVVNWKAREINATMQNLTFGEKDNIYIPYELTFQSQDAFWRNEEEQSFSRIINTSPKTEQITNLWQEVFPSIIMGFGVWLSGVNTISIKNKGVGITISQSISDGDILVVDGREKFVKLNNTEIDFDGIFPLLETGVNSVVFEINGTFSVNMLMVYKLNLL